MKILTKFAIVLATVALSVSTVMATPTCSNTGLATTYVNADGSSNGYVCDIGNLQFSNFSYAFTPNPGGVDASNVSVSTITTPGDQGLEFIGGWAVGGSNPVNEDSNIKFTVTALSGSIDDLTIDLGSPDFTGGGSVHYTETFCNINNTCSTFVEDSSTSTTAFTSHILLANTALGGPVTSLTVTKDLSLHSNGGTASVSDFDNHYSNVPEPRAISFLLTLAFLGGLALFKRRQAVQN